MVSALLPSFFTLNSQLTVEAYNSTVVGGSSHSSQEPRSSGDQVLAVQVANPAIRCRRPGEPAANESFLSFARWFTLENNDAEFSSMILNYT